MSDEMPEWVKEIEKRSRNSMAGGPESRISCIKLISALRCAMEALEYFKDAMHNEGEELKEGYAREALEKIKEGKFDE